MLNMAQIMVMLFSGMLLFSACADDNDSNPTLKQPATFVLNQPGLAGNVYDLQNGSAITLTASQPDYGYTAPVVYGVQMSMNNQWTDSTSYLLPVDNSKTPKVNVSTTDVDKGIMKLANITDAAQLTPDSAYTVYVRMSAVLPSDSTTKVYSNSVALKVMPYYLQLKDTPADYWYLVGGCIGDGNWTSNSTINAYLSIFPLSLVQDYSYNKATGTGIFTYTGYFKSSDGFKLKHNPADWAEQWGSGASGFVKNDGGSGNISVAADGYYTVTLNTNTDKLTVEKADITPSIYTTVSIIGLNNDWTNDIDMTPAKNATNNHMWTATITATAKTEFKFRVNHDWGTNWGYGSANGVINAFGWGVLGGSNIGLAAGKYVVYFNDIDRYFRIIPVSE